MNVKADITQDDWQMLVQHVLRGLGKEGHGQKVLAAFGIGAGAGLVLFWVMPKLGFQFHSGSLLVGMLGTIFCINTLSKLRMKRLGPLLEGFVLGPRQVTVSDDGIKETTRLHESFFRWACVRSVDETAQHVFVMLDRNAGLILPKRAFSTDGDREQFVNEVRNRSGKPALLRTAGQAS
jgi:hypothetical protein